MCDTCSQRIPKPRRSDARFCSPACRQRAYRARKTTGMVPAELRSADRWMRYRLVPRGDRMTKVPTQVNGRNASSTAPGTWSTYADAAASKVGHGLGFALGDGVGVIDLDDAIDHGVIAPWAQAVLDANPDTFTEVSQSGAGIHVWGLLPEGRGRVIRDGRNIEIYSAGRFIALGAPLRGTSPVLRPLVIPE